MNGADVKSFRTERGWSQDRLAKETGVARRTLQHYEARTDQECPKVLALALAAIAFRLPPWPGVSK